MSVMPRDAIFLRGGIAER